MWADCMNNIERTSLLVDSDASRHLCLCLPGTSYPDHANYWFSYLYACARCVEDALGREPFRIANALHDQQQQLCRKAIRIPDFVHQAHHLGLNNDFPLKMPEAILSLPSDSRRAKVEDIVAKSFPPDWGNSPGTLAFSDIAYVVPTGPTPTTVTVPAQKSQSREVGANGALSKRCNHDSCLRSFIRFRPAAISFCNAYMTKTIRETTSTVLPDFVRICKNDRSILSSACACLGAMASQTSALQSSSITASSATPGHEINLLVPASFSNTLSTFGKPATKFGIEKLAASSTTHHISTTYVTIWDTIYPTRPALSISTSVVGIALTSTLLPRTWASFQESSLLLSSTSPKLSDKSSLSFSIPISYSGKWSTLPPSDAMVKCQSGCNSSKIIIPALTDVT
jgi:hypothetical protein